MPEDRRQPQRRAPLDERLAERAGRNIEIDPTTPLVDAEPHVLLERAEDRVVAALGALVLRHAARFGQTRALLRSVEQTLALLTSDLDSRDMMTLEVEAYGIVDWFVGGTPRSALDADRIARRVGDTVHYDPNASIGDLLVRAIDEGFDVRVDYFSRKRGEMNTRRVTPMRIEAEVYLVGWCHARRATRNFRINRITRCIPINGSPNDAPRQVSAANEAEGPRQISLLDDD
ncbi:MAG: WYL domain-containing protein [Deltaproteobacteria bacterium]|nr:MAG: WYL domain-containing protein [Deltaproteobacteria bacterium]